MQEKSETIHTIFSHNCNDFDDSCKSKLLGKRATVYPSHGFFKIVISNVVCKGPKIVVLHCPSAHYPRSTHM